MPGQEEWDQWGQVWGVDIMVHDAVIAIRLLGGVLSFWQGDGQHTMKSMLWSSRGAKTRTLH